ncbi:MAG: WG repeat-containing protein [Pyrinomonadaceae bacterium]|nr:WG repeat-containing protein [Pyrinomonadaceae bacterium]
MAGICFYEEGVQTFLGDGKCGFIDKTGKLVIEPKYKKIGYFSEGLAAVSEDSTFTTLGKYGYIDKTGKLVIEPKYSSNGAFSEGLVAVAEQVGKNPDDTPVVKYGYIDKTGKYVIEQDYKLLSSFGDGHAIVAKAFGINQYIIIDKTGKDIKTIQTGSAGNTDYSYQTTFKNSSYEEYAVKDKMPSFNEGLMMTYSRGKSQPTGFTNTKGELEIDLDPRLIGQIRPFSEGFAPVGFEVLKKEELTAIMGSEVMKDFYDWTYIDRKGVMKVKLDDPFQNARPFAEGMAAVIPRTSDRRWAFINTEFKLAIPACFEKVNDFRGGLASVFVVQYANEKKGCEQYFQGTGVGSRDAYIDKTGNVVKPQW